MQKKNIFLKIKDFQYIVQKNNENKKLVKLFLLFLQVALVKDFGNYLEKVFLNDFLILDDEYIMLQRA